MDKEEFGELKAHVEHMREDINEMKCDIKALLAWRNRVLGMSALMGGSMGFIFALILKIIAG